MALKKVKDFSKFKNYLSDALVARICPIGKKIKDLNNDKNYLSQILCEGASKANLILSCTASILVSIL